MTFQFVFQVCGNAGVQREQYGGDGGQLALRLQCRPRQSTQPAGQPTREARRDQRRRLCRYHVF